MKYIVLMLLLSLSFGQLGAQSPKNAEQAGGAAYDKAMEAYKQQDYQSAATAFDQAFAQLGYGMSSSKLYDGACIYALAGKQDRAIELLVYLTEKKFYANDTHLMEDADLVSLRKLPAWPSILARAAANKNTLPQRTLKQVAAELEKAKAILLKDGGRLWGEQIWTDSVLVLAPDYTVYTPMALPGFAPTGEGLYTRKLEQGTLGFSNASQQYQGKLYAVVMTSYLADSSATIIHELFHSLQFRKRKLMGEPVNYLDEYRPRELLRLEYQALRNAIGAIEAGGNKQAVLQYTRDALRYRKLRQGENTSYRDAELQIETLEGLANYTGLILSGQPDKGKQILAEIDGREKAPSYTRTFPYATGPAYGYIFDHLNLNWRQGLSKLYDFLEIFEKLSNSGAIDTTTKALLKSNKRNSYETIHSAELERKQKFDERIARFKKMFVESPVLMAVLDDRQYSMSYDMNGTTVLKDIGIVYTSIRGTDLSGKNFGSFKVANDNQEQLAGVLGDFKSQQFVFPLPDRIEGQKISGKGYEIVLNSGWELHKKNEKGDMEIVKKK